MRTFTIIGVHIEFLWIIFISVGTSREFTGPTTYLTPCVRERYVCVPARQRESSCVYNLHQVLFLGIWLFKNYLYRIFVTKFVHCRYSNIVSGLQENRRFHCGNCSASYKNKKHLHQHLHYECGVEPKFTCEYCGRKYKRKYSYTMHLKMVHRVGVATDQLPTD